MSILNSIKKLLGIDAEDTSFDGDIIMQINSAFLGLTQLGAGPKTGFSIVDNTETWSSFIGEEPYLGAVKIYVFNKVKLAFDPPPTSFVIDAMNKQTAEIEWRINIAAEGGII